MTFLKYVLLGMLAMAVLAIVWITVYSVSTGKGIRFLPAEE